MFGYSECEYTVERTATIAVNGGTQTLELREVVVKPRSEAENEMWAQIIAQTPPAMRQPESHKRSKRYISIQGEKCDLLLIYRSYQALDIEADWHRLVSEPKVDVEDLLCFERIAWHAMGYTKDGGVTMY